MSIHPYVMHPCDNCPFRKDSLPGWLGKQRASEIAEDANAVSFTCHKTNQFADLGQTKVTEASKHCAGAALVIQKEGGKNAHMKFSDSCRIDDYQHIRGSELAFDSFDEFVEHHAGNKKKAMNESS